MHSAYREMANILAQKYSQNKMHIQGGPNFFKVVLQPVKGARFKK